ncbi:MAG: phosphatidylglycerol lysyltransferase domain-containing protein [Niabella sp.]
MRNSLNSLEKKGFTTECIPAPLDEELLRELGRVSDEWLSAFNKKEMGFAQGYFDMEAVRKTSVVVVRDEAGIIQSFLNIIPDYTPQECTYDLIRRRAESPGGCMDAMIIELVEYARQQGYKFLNLGLVPMSGLNEPDNAAEQIVKYASTRMGAFRHYQTLKDFKEKYATIWENKYLVFANDFELLQIPTELKKVMSPKVSDVT